jgi:hypothetical protein
MLSIRGTSTFVAGIAAFAFAIMAFAFAPAASAQTMGEYGVTMGHAAASAGAAPAIAPNLGGDFHASAGNRGGSSATQTVEIREDDSEEAAPPKARSHAKDSDSGDSADDWVQVK